MGHPPLGEIRGSIVDSLLRCLLPEEEEGFLIYGHSRDQSPDLPKMVIGFGPDQGGTASTMLGAISQYSGYGPGGSEKRY
jgi:hypothetical protein